MRGLFLQYLKCPYLPQHFLYLFPLPHGQGSLRLTFFSASLGCGQFNNISKSVISSGLSRATSIVCFQPFFSKIFATSCILFFVFTLTTAGCFEVPNFTFFFPSNFFSIFSPIIYYRIKEPCSPAERDFRSAPTSLQGILDCKAFYQFFDSLANPAAPLAGFPRGSACLSRFNRGREAILFTLKISF